MNTTTSSGSSYPILQYFSYEHLPEHLRVISRECAYLAEEMAELLPPGPEVSTGLRKLLEAKDCFVRAQLQGDPARDVTSAPAESQPPRSSHREM